MPGDRRPFAANVSITGNALAELGVPWFVPQSTGSAAKTGIVACCTPPPVVLSAIAGGPVIDPDRTAPDLVCGTAVATVPLLQFAGVLQFWMLGPLMAVIGLFHAPGATARGAPAAPRSWRQRDAPGASSTLRVGVRPRPTSGDPPQPGHPRRQREVHLPAGASLSIVRPPCRSLGDPRTGRGDDDDQTG